MSLAVLLHNSLCLIKVAILRRRYIIFFALPTKYSLVSNNKIGANLPSYSCRSAGWLAWYGITKYSRSRKDNMLLMSMLWGIYIGLPLCFKDTVFNRV